MEASQVKKTSLRDLLHVLFKRKTPIRAFFFVTVCAVAIATLRMQPVYEASSQLLVKVGRENIYIPTVPTSGNSSPIISPNREERINSEIEILKSGVLAEEVVRSMGPENIYKDLKSDSESKISIFDKAVAKIEDNLDVKGIEKSDVIQVTFRHSDPHIAAAVVNSIVDSYLDHHLDIHKNPKSFEFFRNQSEVLRSSLNQSEERLGDFKREHDVSSLSEERSLLLEREAGLRSSLNQTQSQLAETDKRIKELRSQLANTPATILREEEVDHSPNQIGDLQARLVELELEEKKLLIKYTDRSRLVQNVREEMGIVSQKLAEQEQKRFGVSRTGTNANYQRLQQLLSENEAEHKALEARLATQTAQLAAYRGQLGDFNRIEMELNQLEQRVEVDRQNYRLYLTKFEESRISDAMDAEKIANVSLFEPAKPPLSPVGPNVLFNLVAGLFAAGFGALALAFFLEYFDDTLERTEDVENLLQLPVLASIPQLNR